MPDAGQRGRVRNWPLVTKATRNLKQGSCFNDGPLELGWVGQKVPGPQGRAGPRGVEWLGRPACGFQPLPSLCPGFVGVLLGIAIRTGSPLSLSLAEPVWKQLAGMSLTIADLSEVTPRREGLGKVGSPGRLRGAACSKALTLSWWLGCLLHNAVL